MLKLSALFHLNLMYSSIAESARADVIRRCYHPLLDLAESGVPLAVEASGLTLEIAARLDPGWVDRLRTLIAGGGVEYVGSGYAQLIGPLVPWRVNERNLALGREVAAQLLNARPRLWLVNEMAWSAGLARIYAGAGAEAVVMEWNNARAAHPEWDAEWRFGRQRLMGPEGARVTAVWVDTIDFQKLQRHVAGELDRDAWLDYWRGRRHPDGRNRFALAYGSDAEVFGFRPGRYREEGAAAAGEWERLGTALRAVADEPGMEWAPITAWLDETHDLDELELRLETAGQPVVVKKQQKYNVNRWAVSGRGDLELNTACHALAADLADAPDDDPRWRELCRLWSSDLRTHLAEDRWTQVAPHLGPPPAWTDEGVAPADARCGLTGAGVSLALNPARGLCCRELRFDVLDGEPVLGTLPLGYYDDIALGADFYTGHAVVQRPGERKTADLVAVEARRTADGGLTATARNGEMTVHKTWRLAGGAVALAGMMELPARRPGEIHPCHLSVIPGVFDPSSLGFAVRNGGREREVFLLGDGAVNHGEAYSTLVTAKGGLGATDGELLIGDNRRRLVITHDPAVSALIPTIHHVPAADGRYFLRIRYSAQEMDETFVADERPWRVAWSLIIRAEDRGVHLP